MQKSAPPPKLKSEMTTSNRSDKSQSLEAFKIQARVRQGEKLSPMLFGLTSNMDEINKKVVRTIE